MGRKCNPHVWDDVKEINEIYDLPDTAQHHVNRSVDYGCNNEKLKL